MIATNFFISAILNPKGRVAEALNKALSPPFYAVTSIQNPIIISVSDFLQL